MRGKTHDNKLSTWGELFRSGAKIVAVVALVVGTSGASTVAQEKGQKTFASPEEASQALMTALQSNNEKEILDVLGKDAKTIITSGDDEEDRQSRTNFIQSYQEMHRLVLEPDGSTTLYIGAKNWPTPIPLVTNKANQWYFDSEAGKKEVLFRRIGRNEISTMHVCRELVAAQKEYYSTKNASYAMKIRSDAGQANGLYWEASGDMPKSPIGPLVASAVGEGYAKSQGSEPTPYRGYYFHVLTSQGKDAPGGAKSYIKDGKMTEGFAFVAYPAVYRSSGVMTFIVGSDGVIYQKDLGKRTEVIASSMKVFNPDSTWQKADEAAEMTASDHPTN